MLLKRPRGWLWILLGLSVQGWNGAICHMRWNKLCGPLPISLYTSQLELWELTTYCRGNKIASTTGSTGRRQTTRCTQTHFPTCDVKFIACFLKHLPRFCYRRGTALENPQRLLKHKENPVRLGPRCNLSTTVFLSSGQAEAHEKMTSKI